jgi:hypothetical protein
MNDVMFIPRRMHRSPAFQKLTANSILVLFEFLFRRQLVKVGRRDSWITKNNGEIINILEVNAVWRRARRAEIDE